MEVFDPDKPDEPLGKFALNPYPIHHPEGRDVAFIHLKQEEETLKLMNDLGVDVLHLRDLDKIYEKGDEVSFDGYVVAEPNQAESDQFYMNLKVTSAFTGFIQHIVDNQDAGLITNMTLKCDL